MSKRKQPITSIQAHDSVKPNKEALYIKIIEGLEKLRVGGHFEAVAKAAGITPAQAWKRLSELVENGTCFNTGVTHKTSSGRSAMVRQLSDLKHIQPLSTPIPEPSKEKPPTPPKNKPQQQYIQNDLFFNNQTRNYEQG